jgi:phosphoheptose isomerase
VALSFNGAPIVSIVFIFNYSAIDIIRNDLGYSYALSHKVQYIPKRGDVVITIFNGSNSKNVVTTAIKALAIGVAALMCIGNVGSKLNAPCFCLCASSSGIVRTKS